MCDRATGQPGQGTVFCPCFQLCPATRNEPGRVQGGRSPPCRGSGGVPQRTTYLGRAGGKTSAHVSARAPTPPRRTGRRIDSRPATAQNVEAVRARCCAIFPFEFPPHLCFNVSVRTPTPANRREHPPAKVNQPKRPLPDSQEKKLFSYQLNNQTINRRR